MPALEVFGRSWRIGSDDFVFPATFEILIRGAWLILAIALFVKHFMSQGTEEDVCKRGTYLLNVYLIGVIVILSVTVLVSLLLVVHSARGTIMNTTLRRHVPKILLLRLILGIPEVSWNIFGTMWLHSNRIECDTTAPLWIITEILVVITWLALSVLIISILILFEPILDREELDASHNHSGRQYDVDNSIRTPYRKLWEKRFRLMCCYYSSDENSTEAFKSIAEVVASIFEESSFVVSDIAAALVLLRIKHKNQENSMINKEFPVVVTSIDEPPDWMNLKNAQHFMKYSFASYGWAWLLYRRFISGSLSLWKYLKFCRCCSSYNRDIKDNCCMCNMAALKKITGLSLENIIYVSFHNKIYEVPFFVAIDDESENVVVTLRGTLSLHDAMTDLSAECTTINSDGVEYNCGAHKGMVSAAEFVRRRLQETCAIEEAFQRRPAYGLVITGHSLGAGSAVVLACMLRPQYPQLRCYAFSPPGGLCSRELSHTMKSYVMSVIVGDDLVPRLSLESVRDLHRNITTVLTSCKKPKYRVLASGCWFICFGIPQRPVDTSVSHHSLIDTEEGSDNSDRTSSTTSTLVTGRTSHVPLYPPGRVLHIKHSYDTEDETKLWHAVWKDCFSFSEIIISPDMMKDHLPQNVLEALTSLVPGS